MKLFVTVVVLVSVLGLCQAMPDKEKRSDDKKSDSKSDASKSDASKSDDPKDKVPSGVGGLGDAAQSPPPNITVGGVTELPTEDHAEVIEHLKICLPRLSTGATGAMELVAVTKVTKQIVSGIIYEVEGDFKVGDNKKVHCFVTVWYKGWMDTVEEKYQVKGSCADQTATWRPKDDAGDW